MGKGEMRPDGWTPPCGEFLLALGLAITFLCGFAAWLFGG